MKLKALGLLALLALPLIEIGSHVAARAAVPAGSDWRAAAAFVRSQLAPRDLITSAPGWTDPLLREVLGDRIDAAMAGRSDDTAYERLWSLDIRGARPERAPSAPPELEQRFGGVTVQRWKLGRSSVTLDLTEQIARGTLRFDVMNGSSPCATRTDPRPARGGGLGFGVLPPMQRVQCGGRGSPWVAPVVMEDLALAARRCIFQPAGVGVPVRVTMHEVAFADRLVLYGGLYSEHERMREGAPVEARISAGERELGHMTHADGEGWKRIELSTAALRGTRGDLSIEVSSRGRSKRSFCWAASLHEGASR